MSEYAAGMLHIRDQGLALATITLNEADNAVFQMLADLSPDCSR